MNDFIAFMSQINAVDSKMSPAIEWLRNKENYDFLEAQEENDTSYKGFVENLISSYYGLLLQPFVAQQEEEMKKKDGLSLGYDPEIDRIFRTIIFNDVWKVSSHHSSYDKVNLTRDLLLIGLLVLVNRYALFEELKDILAFLSNFEMHDVTDLLPLYERLAVRYEEKEGNTLEAEDESNVELDKILPFLSFSLEKTKEDSKELQLIFKELSKSRHVKDYLVKKEELKVYKVCSEVQREHFNPQGLKTRLLVHGTKNHNILSILEHGIEASPKVIATGSALGVGAYFAKMTEVGKSAQYSDDFLILAEVALGKRHYTNQVRDYRQEVLDEHTPFDSVHYLGGQYSTFSYDELVVYRKEQICVKYLIQLH